MGGEDGRGLEGREGGLWGYVTGVFASLVDVHWRLFLVEGSRKHHHALYLFPLGATQRLVVSSMLLSA